MSTSKELSSLSAESKETSCILALKMAESTNIEDGGKQRHIISDMSTTWWVGRYVREACGRKWLQAVMFDQRFGPKWQ